MKRWLKRFSIFWGVAALLVVLFVAVEHIRGRRALNNRLSRLKSQGEELSVTRLMPRRPPVDQNAFPDLQVLTNQIKALQTNLNRAPLPLHFVAPGKGIVAWRLKEWSLDQKTTNTWRSIGSAVEEAGNLFAKIHSALRKSAFDSEFDFSKNFQGMVFPSLVTVRLTSLDLGGAARYEMSQGHLEAANSHLCDLAKLAGCQTPEPLVICQLVRQACSTVAFNATWEALQAPDWSEVQLAALQSAWEGSEFSQDMEAAMEMERAMEIDYFEQLKHSHAKLAVVLAQRETVAGMTDGMLGSTPTHGALLKWVHAPLWQIAWADQEALIALNRWGELIGLERTARTNKAWAAVSPHSTTDSSGRPLLSYLGRPEQLSWYDRSRLLFSEQIFSINDLLIRKTVEAQTQQEMVIAAIAITRYRLRHGALPSDLSSLVPEFLKTLPRDWMDGKTLRYQLHSPKGFALYSVGEDGQDDGGDPSLPLERKTSTRIWDGRDAVWPAPATDEEAANALNSSKGESPKVSDATSKN